VKHVLVAARVRHKNARHFPHVSTSMKLPSLATSTSIVLLGALLSGCATTPNAATTGKAAPCDTTQSVGSCAVTVQKQGSRLVVCPVQNSAAPVCMNSVVDVQRPGRKPQQVQFMLEPGQCQPLSTEIINATPASCAAFATRARDTAKAPELAATP
jgi:hypothetical protein